MMKTAEKKAYLTPAERRLLDRLPVGMVNAIPEADLAREFGVDARTIRLYMNTLRKVGFLACSCEEGLFIPANKSEFEWFFYRRYVVPAVDCLQAYEAMKPAADLLPDVEATS